MSFYGKGQDGSIIGKYGKRWKVCPLGMKFNKL